MGSFWLIILIHYNNSSVDNCILVEAGRSLIWDSEELYRNLRGERRGPVVQPQFFVPYARDL